jgi:hypothetical protein
LESHPDIASAIEAQIREILLHRTTEMAVAPAPLMENGIHVMMDENISTMAMEGNETIVDDAVV